MGLINTDVTITNLVERSNVLKCTALVDTASTFLILPMQWKDKLGQLEDYRQQNAELADQSKKPALIGGGVLIEIDGFHPIFSEVMFMEMEPDEDGEFEPLLGHGPLQQAHASVDMANHRLVKAKKVHAK